MKIWIDLRFVKNELYSRFAIQLVKTFIKQNKDNEYIIYVVDFIDELNIENCNIKKVNIKNWSLNEQFELLKIFKKDENNLMIFFNHFKPTRYKWEYITIVSWLKDIYYMNFSSYFEKYKYLFLMNKNLKKSHKIVCLDQNTKNELIEKFDIKESSIHIINWFFPEWDQIIKVNDNLDEININIKTKYSLNNDYLIYSWWDSIEKNYEKLILVLKRIRESWQNIDLVFLWNNISTNINLRNIILENKMEKNIYFLWDVWLSHKKYLYSESLWVIFPSFYEQFPFRLSEPLYFGSNIISSDLKNIRNIFWDKLTYFSPISVNSIFENTKKYLENEVYKTKPDYEEIKNKYTKENSARDLLEIIK